jgi:anhydro-N-acetylmuramic acid kinase
MPAPFRAVGVISGTSMDAIDVALVETDGERNVRPVAGVAVPYPAGLRARLLAVAADAAVAAGDLPELEAEVTQAHGDAIATLLAGVDAGPDIIGLHGQTVLHRPERRLTRQLGDGAAIARRFGVPTVARFRDADVADGGQGAPFAPLYHAALAHGLAQPLAVLNLGGVGNVTFLDGEVILAFDTGPGSALIDDFVRRRRGQPFDAGGRLAAAGTPDRAVVARFRALPFLAAPPPKSLDRNDFSAFSALVEDLDDRDGAATLAALTIASIPAALPHLPRPPLRWLVTGGGRHNAHLLHGLRDALGVPVDAVEAVGWDGDLIEAQCFGHLAVRALHGLPLSVPTTTGVSRPMPGGVVFRP